ncbi:glycosyltransferase family 2 protein [uncultured Faecalibaculum sp.]|uniref:glycosyltransferase family 2 protein n=1 Tax=uncultured Faecalibaculum sp. TaxID=1729681 RepID=UPI00272E648F|nr:glycosyltransferase family 2 protein [uncultured Faecalibaculum sp.]
MLIPCYNEALTVEKVIHDYRTAFPTADIYVYDNNSTDDTAKIANNAGAIVKHEYSQGKGNVIRAMFKDIDADCYIMADGDNTNPPVPEMAEIILRGEAEMVIGDRLSSTYFEENKRLFHNTGNKLVRSLINTLFDVNVTDIMTGSRAFSYTFVKTFPVLSKGFEIETEMTIHAAANNLRMVEVPTNYRDRPEGSESKLNTYSDGFKVLKTIARLFKEYKPMAFFGILAIIAMVISIILAIPVFNEYFQTGVVLRFPTLIVAGFIFIVSLLLLMIGILLEVIAKKNRQLFEMFYIRTKR